MFRNIYTRRLPFLNTDLCFSPNPFIKGILSLVTDRNPTAHTVSHGALQAFAFFLFITSQWPVVISGFSAEQASQRTGGPGLPKSLKSNCLHYQSSGSCRMYLSCPKYFQRCYCLLLPSHCLLWHDYHYLLCSMMPITSCCRSPHLYQNSSKQACRQHPDGCTIH